MSRPVTDRRTDADVDLIRVTGVLKGEDLVGADGGELTCSERELRYTGIDGEPLTIPVDDVEFARVDVDKSVTGFNIIAGAFGFTGFLMWCVFIQHVVVGGGSIVTVVAGGSGLSGVLSVFGFFWIRRLEEGRRRVLQLDHCDRSRTVFIVASDEVDGEFEEIRAVVE